MGRGVPLSPKLQVFINPDALWTSSLFFFFLMSVSQFSHSVVSDSATPWTAARQFLPVRYKPPEFTQTHVHWVGDAIQPSHRLVVSFSSPFQSFPASGSLQMSQFFTSDGQRIGGSSSASVLPMNIQDWFPLGWTGWISLRVQGILKSLLQHHSSKASILRYSAFFIVQLSHPYMTTRKTKALTRWTFVDKVVSLLSNMLSRFVTPFSQGAIIF